VTGAERGREAKEVAMGEAKASGSAQRKARRRTWHSTTAQVAEAFVSREAPRGFVSGESLFFHGPIAFSVWYGNPIAAFVETPDGETVLFLGRHGKVLKPAVVSMAQGDIVEAAGGRFPIIRMDGLGAFLSLGDVPAGIVALRLKGRKDEDRYPRAASIVPSGLARWFEDRHSELVAERDAAHRSGVTFQTWRQVQSMGALVDLCDLRDRLSERFGIGLPALGDAQGYRADHAKAQVRCADRQTELDARKAAKAPSSADPDAGDEEPEGGMRP
jgi:hypothetical protein